MKPNILVIFADQMRADALGCAGHPVVKTPNLDRLAEQGVFFENAYTPDPICVPARASFTTATIRLNVQAPRKTVARFRMIRSRSLSSLLTAGVEEFYDLERDPEERENLVKKPEIQSEMKRMKDLLVRWLSETGDASILENGHLRKTDTDVVAAAQFEAGTMGWRWY